MDSQSWFLTMDTLKAGFGCFGAVLVLIGRCGRSFVFLGRQYATLDIRGAVLGRHIGHDSCCCSVVSQPANGLSKLVSAI